MQCRCWDKQQRPSPVHAANTPPSGCVLPVINVPNHLSCARRHVYGVEAAPLWRQGNTYAVCKRQLSAAARLGSAAPVGSEAGVTRPRGAWHGLTTALHQMDRVRFIHPAKQPGRLGLFVAFAVWRWQRSPGCSACQAQIAHSGSASHCEQHAAADAACRLPMSASPAPVFASIVPQTAGGAGCGGAGGGGPGGGGWPPPHVTLPAWRTLSQTTTVPLANFRVKIPCGLSTAGPWGRPSGYRRSGKSIGAPAMFRRSAPAEGMQPG